MKITGLGKTKILSTTKSISEIAYDFGFEYPQSFNKLFKSKTGWIPADFNCVQPCENIRSQ